MDVDPATNARGSRFRPWFRFRAQTGWIVATLVGCCLVAIGVKVVEGRRQQTAVVALQQLGGEVYYDYEFNSQGLYLANSTLPEPEWLRALLGDDFFRNVHWISLGGQLVTDTGLQNLQGLSRLEWLSLNNAPAVTYAGLEQLRALNQLDELYLYGTQVTAAGVARLQRALPRCDIQR
jgi:hypothetical protein